MPAGRCHCGAVAYRFEGQVQHSSVCHCSDCRRCAGATGVAWIGVAADGFSIGQGEPTRYVSSPDARRSFCGRCGTGLFYENEAILPGIVDIQTATLDDPEQFAPDKHVQMADGLDWEATLASLPQHARFPSG
ncbi:GFA family protein [Qipengyuania sp. CAU 1752]